MKYYLREINRSFIDFVLLGIEDDIEFPKVGEDHCDWVLANRYSTLYETIWRKGDGKQLNGNKFESQHLGECKLITDEEAQDILVESEKEIKD